ncbi:MAG: response regulator, partial [bacterium]|nr:response regulator [bacterium]
SNDAITLIHEGPEGYLWIGTNRGLNRLKPGDNAFKTYITGNGPAGNTIKSICRGSEGVLWVGTGSGLNRLKNGELKRISAEDGLYDDNILQVLGDDLGKLWINSDKGIFNVGLKQLNDICDGKRTTLHCIPYNEAGSAGECASTGQPGSIKSNDGHLWFSTKNGVLIIAPNQIGLNRLPPPVKIEEIVVADEIKSTILPTNRKKILLAPGIKRFEIHYTGLSLLEPGRVRFQYKLEGFDKRWQEADTRRVAYYTNIASGDYLFKVMACNNDGIWNTTGATVAIEQQPRFYRTILFYIICLLAMAAVVFAGYRHQFHHYKAREENLNRMAEERNCELKERNEELETIQKIIKNINSEMGLELLSELLLKSAMELFPQAEKGGMLVYDHSKNTFKVSAQLGYDQTLVDELYLTFEELINRYTVGTEQLEEWIYVLRKFDNISAEQKMKVFPKPRAMLVMALVINGVVEGFLTLSNMVEAHAFDQSDIQKICRFREQVVSALSKARAMEQLESKVEGRTTELLQANKMLSEAKETAEKALESAELANRTKSDFIANMSHEIRTPMNAILGFTEILDSELSDEKHKEFLSAIASSGNTLLALINDILDISRIESGKMELQFEPINVGCVLKDIRNIFVAKVKEKGLTFKLEIDPELPQSLILENSRLRQILFNLVGNAVKFTNQGYIALSARKGDSAAKGKVDVVFMVQDTGIGIPADKLESIFETFSQVNGQRSSDYGGTGLGLTITRRLTEMMGGEISCRSYEGKGSTFNITFKNITISGETKKIETVGESELDTEAIHFEKATILEVDDMDLNRWLIAQYLEEQNFEIIEAENGQQAVALAKEHRPDLILMDLKMPVMNGYEATRTIKTDDRLKHIPVVAVTASVLLEELLEIKKAGSNSYLKKPINRKELFRELMRFLPYTTNEDWVDAERDSLKMQLELSPHASGPISIETRQRLPGLLTILQGEILDQWQDVRQTFMLDEIEGFAKEIQALGREYGLLVIGSWGDRLFNEIRSFNMQKVALTMKSFPELVNEIKMLHEESKNE